MKFQTVKGMRDFGPEEMAIRRYVINISSYIFRAMGFREMDSPVLESLDLLAAKSGEEIKNEIYNFKDRGNRELGLRFDLTVPTARFVANNPNLSKPFKRYQVGKVWRYDQPQAGRWREFLQVDADTFGCALPLADAEVVCAASRIMERFGFKKFVVRLNNKKIVENFLKKLNVKRPAEIFRAIDKLDKIGKKGVEKQLKKVTTAANTKKILSFVSGKKIPNGQGKKELDAVIASIKKLGYEKYVKVDLSLVRGLEYYTGNVFEISVGGKWSVAGGGRYDDLVKMLGGQDTPAVGISMGIERIIQIMKEKKMFIPIWPDDVFVASVNDSVREEALNISKHLRKENFIVSMDIMGRNLKKQLNYASSIGIDFCIIVGPKELKEKRIVLRDMETGKEKKVLLVDLNKALRVRMFKKGEPNRKFYASVKPKD